MPCPALHSRDSDIVRLGSPMRVVDCCKLEIMARFQWMSNRRDHSKRGSPRSVAEKAIQWPNFDQTKFFFFITIWIAFHQPLEQCCSMHGYVTVVTINLACWGWEIWNELETNTSLQFIIEAITKLEQKPTSYSSTQDPQAMWSIQKKVQMHGRANLPKKNVHFNHFSLIWGQFKVSHPLQRGHGSRLTLWCS